MQESDINPTVADEAPKKGIRRAHMATFPDRVGVLPHSVASIAPQVDRVFICLNEYQDVPDFLGKFDNVTAVIPERDYKDVGKFIFQPDPEDTVFLVDDDIEYADNYARQTIRRARGVGLEKRVFGYHATTFTNPTPKSIRQRTLLRMNQRLTYSTRVHQLGTGTVMLSGSLFPTLDYMEGSEKFVDVRFARYCFENDIEMWTLPRNRRRFPSLLAGLEPEKRETIADSFTRRWPQHVLDEVKVFAGLQF